MTRILRNITSNVLSFIVSAVIPIILTPFLIHRLGDSYYGLWILISSVIGYYGLLDLGISSSIIRYVSKYIATNDKDNLNSFVNTALFIFILIGITAMIVSGILSFFLADLFNLSRKDIELFSHLMLVLGFAFAISFPARVFNSILRATQRYDIANTIDISCSFAQAGLTVYFISHGGGLIALGLITLFTRFIGGLFSLIFAIRKTPMLKIGLRLAQRSKLNTIFSYSIFAFIWGIADRLRFQTDSMVIGAFLSASAITFYSIGARLMTYYVEAIGAFTSVTTPMFSSMEAKDQLEKLHNLLINGTRYSSIMAVFVGVSLILYGKPFIQLWVGEGYESSYYVMLILTIPYIIALSQTMSVSAVYGLGKHKFLSIVTLGEGVLNLGLSIILVRHYGIYGVAIGTAIPMFIIKLFVQPVYICKIVNLSFVEYMIELLRPTLVGILYITIAIGVIHIFRLDSYIRLFFSIIFSFLFFVTLATILCLKDNDRKAWKNWIIYRLGRRIL